MKRNANALLAFWILNFGLLLLRYYAPAAYFEMRAAGTPLFQCAEWNERGNAVPSDACVGPAPDWDPDAR